MSDCQVILVLSENLDGVDHVEVTEKAIVYHGETFFLTEVVISDDHASVTVRYEEEDFMVTLQRAPFYKVACDTDLPVILESYLTELLDSDWL